MFQPSRRHFLKTTTCAGVLACAGVSVARAGDAPAAVEAAAAAAGAAERWIELFNTHTAETISVAFRGAMGLLAPALSRLDWVLRDFRVNEQTQMDPLLYDQLADLAVAAGVEPRFEVISGYRSPRTNAALAEAGHGVARHSLHMEGRAIDVRLRGVDCATLRDLALTAARGGVGYYRDSDFVHVDTGRVRTWTG